MDVANNHSVTVIGAGAIGSNAVLLLAKLGIGRIIVYDDDEVSPENLEPQFYKEADVGYPKVEMLGYNVAGFVDDVMLDDRNERWTEDTFPPTRIIVSGVDSLESRLVIAESLRRNPGSWSFYIDMRMGGNVVEMRVVRPGEDFVHYLDEELPNIEPMQIPCSMRSVAYNGMMAAALAARAVTAILAGDPLPSYIKVDLLGWSWDVQFPRLPNTSP